MGHGVSNELLRELVDAVEARRPVVLATVVDTSRSVPRRAGSKMLVFPDGATAGSVGGGEMEARVRAEAASALVDRRPRRITYTLLDPATGDPGVCGGEVELYLEPHMPHPTVYVIGVGHVGRAVVELAKWMGYRVVAWDDRQELTEGVDQADVVLTGTIAEAIAAAPPDEFSRAVMVTRNVALDVEILPALLATPVASIGLMGSGRRWDTTRGLLREQGVSDSDLSRVRTPIGLDISAETPAEIAVSILAQIVGMERGG